MPFPSNALPHSSAWRFAAPASFAGPSALSSATDAGRGAAANNLESAGASTSTAAGCNERVSMA
jgi:hypothetical protein